MYLTTTTKKRVESSFDKDASRVVLADDSTFDKDASRDVLAVDSTIYFLDKEYKVKTMVNKLKALL